jgi:hypothetical protein
MEVALALLHRPQATAWTPHWAARPGEWWRERHETAVLRALRRPLTDSRRLVMRAPLSAINGSGARTTPSAAGDGLDVVLGCAAWRVLAQRNEPLLRCGDGAIQIAGNLIDDEGATAAGHRERWEGLTAMERSGVKMAHQTMASSGVIGTNSSSGSPRLSATGNEGAFVGDRWKWRSHYSIGRRRRPGRHTGLRGLASGGARGTKPLFSEHCAVH